MVGLVADVAIDDVLAFVESAFRIDEVAFAVAQIFVDDRLFAIVPSLVRKETDWQSVIAIKTWYVLRGM